MEEKPDWLDDASEVYSVDSRSWLRRWSVDAETACKVLESANIPSYLDFCEEPSDEDGWPPTHRWRVLVPGNGLI